MKVIKQFFYNTIILLLGLYTVITIKNLEQVKNVAKRIFQF